MSRENEEEKAGINRRRTAEAAAIIAILAMVTTAGAFIADKFLDTPGKRAEAHLEESLESIRQVVEKKREEGPPPSGPEITRCWEDRDPALRPSDRYRVQRCRIHFGGLGHQNLQADHVMLMRERRKIPFRDNHVLVDAYVEADSIRGRPDRNELRP